MGSDKGEISSATPDTADIQNIDTPDHTLFASVSALGNNSGEDLLGHSEKENNNNYSNSKSHKTAATEEEIVDLEMLGPVHSLTEAINKIGFRPFHVQLTLACGFGWLCDNMWTQALSSILPRLEQDPDFGTATFLPSLLFAGMALGSMVWGMSADIIGRRASFFWTLIIASAAGLASAFSVNIYMFSVLMVVLGFGIGGNLPIDGSYFAEFMPMAQRGKMLVLLSVFWSFGSVLTSGLSLLIIPPYSCDGDVSVCPSSENRGWRYFFVVLGILNVLFVLLRLGMPESPTYLMSKGRRESAALILNKIGGFLDEEMGSGLRLKYDDEIEIENRNRSVSESTQFVDSIKTLTNEKYLVTTMLLSIIWFGVNFGYTSFNMFLPTYLEDKGVNNTSNLYLYTLLYAFAGVLGSLSGAYAVESFLGRKYTLGISTLAGVVFQALFAVGTSVNEIVAYTCLFSYVGQIMWAAIFAYTPEVFPTSIRGTGSGFCTSVSRVAGILAPLSVTWLRSSVSDNAPIISGPVIMGVSGLLVFFLPIETRGGRLH
eukprot:Nk52_evm16s2622 gene=Nk52_evmTU16s2622